jgi:glucose-6-phosphate-specific signal transduction histidine kinase
VSHLLWFLPAGLRLGALWLAPSRRWGWLALGEWSAMSVLAWYKHWDLLSVDTLVMSVTPWLIYAAVVRAVRGGEAGAAIDDPRAMLRLLASGLLAAALVSPVLQQLMPDQTGRLVGVAGLFSFLYGDFIGQLVLAPLLLLLGRAASRRRLDGALWRDVALQLLLSASVFALVRAREDLAPFLILLAFAPIFFVAFRRGWEGATVSVAMVGLLIEVLIELDMVPVDMRVLQLALAVVGGGGLVLGAASSELRRSHERLAQRHRELAQVNRSLTDAAVDLRNISQRLVRLEERGQRELATELDYELGRSIHALSTRISLAFRDVRDETTLRLLESVREQVREMQDALRRALRQLRPQVLDTHGLREAVGFGPLRETLEDAGIGYDTRFVGRVEALDDDARTTVYRICQAAVREASRGQAVRRLGVQVSVQPGNAGRLHVQIDIELEGRDAVLAPLALPAITDRVLAQQGSYWVEETASGICHRVRFEEDAVAP